MGHRTNPDIQCVRISVNTSALHPQDRRQYLDDFSKDTSLPCVDPLIYGCASIVKYIKEQFGE